jgi:hypothetical protein
MLAEVIANNVQGTPWGGPIGEQIISVGGQTFNGFYEPNSKACDEVARVCPSSPSELNGISCCTVIGGADAASYQAECFVARSHHNGGVHAARADGSVSFYNDSINIAVWRSLSTSKNGEVFNDLP